MIFDHFDRSKRALCGRYRGCCASQYASVCDDREVINLIIVSYFVCTYCILLLICKPLTFYCLPHSCVCAFGFTGPRCDTIDQCAANADPCINGAQCLNAPNPQHATLYTCQCLPGFSGADCQTEDYCAAQPCPQGAPCVNQQDTFYCDYCAGKSFPS